MTLKSLNASGAATIGQENGPKKMMASQLTGETESQDKYDNRQLQRTQKHPNHLLHAIYFRRPAEMAACF
jgi:hypothetical protein